MRWCSVLCGLVVGCGPSIEDSVAQTSGGSSGPATVGTTSSASADATTAASADATGDAGTSSSSTTGEPVVSCFPVGVEGEPAAQHPSGLVAYADCEDGYFIEHFGEAVVTSVDDVSMITDASELGSIDGLNEFGVGLCCGNPEACILLRVNAANFDLQALLDALSAAFPAAEGQCFGLQVTLVGYAGPRCEPSDPDCIPLPYCAGEPSCCNDGAYDPAAPRTPVGPDELSEGGCAHDGECVLNGQGERCMNWMLPPMVSLGLCEPVLDAAFCGCVDDECQWFEQ